MPTLILNAGSSSLRFALFDEKLQRLYKGHIDAIGQKHCMFRRYFDDNSEARTKIKAKDHAAAITFALGILQEDGAITNLSDIKKVGHRVVHGGEEFRAPSKLSTATIRKLEKFKRLAPLHNPANLAAVKASKKLLPRAAHFAIFDTAFHSTLPEHAFLYGLPYELYKKEGIRRYGFHGTSHKYVAGEAARIMKKPRARIITCHMGNGISLAAVRDGKCLDTSMGMTPLEGPPMGTRSGSIDPAIIFHLAKKFAGKASKKSPTAALEKVHHMLEHESGFLGLSGMSSDVRKLWAKPNSPGTRRTFNVLAYQIAKLISSYFPALGGPPDALVFTAGIGEHAWYLRKQICDYLKPMDIRICNRRNKAHAKGGKPDSVISNQFSKTKILVIPTNEELQMAKEIGKL